MEKIFTYSTMTSKKGFTLIEILLVITVMVIIAIAALTSTVNTQKQFVFINTFKELLGKVREARLYAVTQRTVDFGEGETIPPVYGVYIKKNSGNFEVKIFADNPDAGTQNEYDAEDGEIGQTLKLDATKYNLEAKYNNAGVISAIAGVDIPNDNSLTLLYQPNEIKITATGKNAVGNVMISEPYIYLTLTDKNQPTLSKNIAIFLRSGIAEEIQNVATAIQ